MASGDEKGAVRYDRLTILLHWLVVLAIAFQWLGAHTIDWFPKGPLRVDARSVHIMIGWILALSLACRIWWRRAGGTRLNPAGPPVLHGVARLMHVLLYANLIGVVGLGIVGSFVRGDDIFGLFHLAKLSLPISDARSQIIDLHRIAANSMLILGGIHALSGLLHHFVLRDGVLQRMWPLAR